MSKYIETPMQKSCTWINETRNCKSLVKLCYLETKLTLLATMGAFGTINHYSRAKHSKLINGSILASDKIFFPLHSLESLGRTVK